MKIRDTRHEPNSSINIELVGKKKNRISDNGWNFSLTKKRGYDGRYQAIVTFDTNINQYDTEGLAIAQKEITKAIEKAFE